MVHSGAALNQKALVIPFVRHTRVRRLLIPAVALVFALVTVWGSFAHACHGSGHGAASEVAVHLHEDAVSASSEHQGDNGDAPATNHSSDRAAHPCCADLTCHGGVAIFAAGLSTTVPQSVAVPFVLTEQTHQGLFRASLDRPPRSFVQF
jgi:hypothetical protein